MKNRLSLASALLLVAGFIAVVPSQADTRVMTRDQIIAAGEEMALKQFDASNWNFWGRFWMDGAFWAGVLDLTTVSENPKLWEALNKMGNRKVGMGKGEARHNYGPWALIHHDREKEPHHADDMLIGEAFLGAYEKTKNPAILEDVVRRLDAASASILSEEMAANAAQARELHWQKGLTWYWCDALFMAPSLHARLSAATGDPKYLQAMHVEWKRASDLLHDEAEHLYFRDKNFLERKTKNGGKTFWSRGNGWVMGAFARTLPYIPQDDPRRPWYVNQFKAMSARLAELQRPDGTWSPSLLDYAHFPYSETSGTALNTFAMAWGVNNGLLDEKTYRPVIEKAWAALLAARNERGFLGYVQGIGAEPARVHADQSTLYGNGAFLMTVTQLAQMAPLNLPPVPELKSAPRPVKK